MVDEVAVLLQIIVNLMTTRVGFTKVSDTPHDRATEASII
jgi:hypothetical protein